ncbi:MAG: FMN-binding negative transcriptional regulator [Azoarcus sp.]|nr:FMN-binding negative transcriptional regulator [Azoarcus sp.]
MFIPNSFRQAEAGQLHALIQAHALGLLITHGANGLQASPVPFLLYPDEGEHGVLRAHLARANPHWQELVTCSECLVMFQGENGYVTPSWYPAKAETHRVVPTWNYAVVEVRGGPSVIEAPAWLRRQLDDLTRRHEGKRPRPWAVTDAPADYIATQMKAIVGIEITITGIAGKWKMSQNKSEADRSGVVSGLRAERDPHRNPELADQVEASNQKGG